MQTLSIQETPQLVLQPAAPSKSVWVVAGQCNVALEAHDLFAGL